jgi:hypothetical protein
VRAASNVPCGSTDKEDPEGSGFFLGMFRRFPNRTTASQIVYGATLQHAEYHWSDSVDRHCRVADLVGRPRVAGQNRLSEMGRNGPISLTC